ADDVGARVGRIQDVRPAAALPLSLRAGRRPGLAGDRCIAALEHAPPRPGGVAARGGADGRGIDVPGPPGGRDAGAAGVEEFLDELEAGSAACLLEGEAGIGKTTVWRYGLEAAEARGQRILACRPVEAESQFSYSGLGDLLAGTSEAVLDVLPGPQRRALGGAPLLAPAEGGRPERGAGGPGAPLPDQ